MTARHDGTKLMERLARRLARLRAEAEDGMGRAVAETAEEIAGHARGTLARAPGGLPRLAGHLETAGEDLRHAVVVRHPAAPHVEFGTRRLPPRPFLQPAATAGRISFRKRIKILVNRLVRGGP